MAMASVAIAGDYTADSKRVAPVVPAAETYGTGTYFAIQGGINAWQSYEGTERFSVGGLSVAAERKEKVGGFGGIKFGHVFGSGGVRQALELDAFYNGVDSEIDLRVDGNRVAGTSQRFDTGAFLLNYIIRFDVGSFQPYLGAGAGFWTGQSNDFRVSIPGVASFRESNNDWEAGFAWQAILGSDIFVSQKSSLFLEYKWLNYQQTDVIGSNDRIGQHLVGAGLRFFF